MGAVNGDLAVARGQIEKHGDARLARRSLRAFVPLSEMFGYTTDLRSATQGRATSTMHFERYEQAPKNVAEEVIAKVQGPGGQRQSSGNSLKFLRSGGQRWQRKNSIARSRT